MLTTEELDALDALLREQDEAAREANEAYRNSWPHSGGDDFLAKQGAIHTTLVRSRNADAAVRDASGSNFKTLLSAAREAATFRAKLIESETWRTELRAEMDAVKGKLRDVTGQRDAAVKELRRHESGGEMMTYCSCCGGESLCDGCEDGCALSAAQEEVKP